VPGERSTVEELGLYDTICEPLVGDTVRILEGLIFRI
jgi:hypothetical protein